MLAQIMHGITLHLLDQVDPQNYLLMVFKMGQRILIAQIMRILLIDHVLDHQVVAQIFLLQVLLRDIFQT